MHGRSQGSARAGLLASAHPDHTLKTCLTCGNLTAECVCRGWEAARTGGSRRHPPARPGCTARTRPGLPATSRRREWIERVGAMPATTPMWSTGAAWLASLREWADAAALRTVCTQLGCSITAATLVSIAAAMTEFADHASGRNMAATRATIAGRVGCSPRTVSTAWRVLRETGWAVEAVRGHGDSSTPTVGRRPSVWHLVPRRIAAVENFHLPPSGKDRFSCPVGNYSPSARNRAPAKKSSTNHRRPASRPQRSPRALPLQRLAAQLAARCHGLHRGHIGALCDALTAAGIDPQRWTARQLIDALNADMRACGWTWPDRIEKPGAFLAARLHHMLAARPTTADEEPLRTRPTPTPPKHTPEPAPILTDVQRARISQIRAEIREQITARRARSTMPTNARRLARRTVVTAAPVTSEPVSATCTACGVANAPRRPFMPARRAHVCDTCWTKPRDVAVQPSEPPQREQPIAIAAAAASSAEGETCVSCQITPGSTRPQLPLASAICDGCWSTHADPDLLEEVLV